MTGMNYPIMKNKDLLLHILLVFVTITALWSGTVSAMEPAFSSLFSSHMVLQRERPISVWGSATPGAELRVSLAEHVQNVRADKSGNWSAELPALPAGGPHRLELAGTDGLVRVLENILIGEVWLCSGQSNTEYPMANLNEPWRDTAKIDSSIRLLTVEHDSSTKPLAEFTEVSGWEIATADTVPSFSAACYLFARALQKDRRIPFGLIDASWGGSSIEAWISARGLKPLDEFQRALELNEVHGRDTGKALQAYVHDWKAWWRAARDDEPAPWKADFEDNGTGSPSI
jgi:sialate O-acetylesterase